jgi:hypothetical protein
VAPILLYVLVYKSVVRFPGYPPSGLSIAWLIAVGLFSTMGHISTVLVDCCILFCNDGAYFYSTLQLMLYRAVLRSIIFCIGVTVQVREYIAVCFFNDGTCTVHTVFIQYSTVQCTGMLYSTQCSAVSYRTSVCQASGVPGTLKD